MAEAERLCDRVAVIDRGRVIALDTPAGLVSSMAAEQRIRFKPSVPVPDGLLSDLPEVTSIARSARSWRCPAPATCCRPSPRCWPGTGSWPPTCGSSRPAWTTPSSR